MNKVFFHFFRLSLILFRDILYFSMHRSFRIFVRIVPKYFIFLETIVKDTIFKFSIQFLIVAVIIG